MAKNTQGFINQPIEQAYFELFKRLFVDADCTTHDGMCIKTQEGHFFHMFYRDKGKTTIYFDQWLADRIQDIHTIITTTPNHTQIFEWINPQSQRQERQYFYVINNIFILLGKNDKTGDLFFITAYRITKNEYKRFTSRHGITRIF